MDGGDARAPARRGSRGDHQLAWARAFAATARTPVQLDLLRALLDGAEAVEGLVVDTELRWAFVERLAAVGLLDEDEIAAEYERDKTAAGERHAATARAARPSAEAKAEAWASVVESDKLPNSLQEAVIGGFVQTDQRELLAPYTEKFFAAVKDVWDSRSHEMAQQIAVGLYPALQVSQETLDATDAWLDSAEPSAALRRPGLRVAGRRGARTEGPGCGRGRGNRVASAHVRRSAPDRPHGPGHSCSATVRRAAATGITRPTPRSGPPVRRRPVP